MEGLGFRIGEKGVLNVTSAQWSQRVRKVFGYHTTGTSALHLTELAVLIYISFQFQN